MNHVELIGNLTRDPVVRQTSTGRAVASFGIALNRSYIDANGQKKDLADFVNVVAWEKLAEAVAKELHKGDTAHIVGRLSSRSYEKNGQKVYVVEVAASFITRPLTKREPVENNAGSTQNVGWTQSGGYSQPQGQAANFQQFGQAPAPSYDQEDIPF